MPLLHWSILTPSPSGIAAIRLSPSRIQSIRIFPTGAQPFLHIPEIVARTEPTAFFLEIFVNAHPVRPLPPSAKQHPKNALIPSVLAYAGNQTEFTLDMGPDYATRLLIVKGPFESLSMAIYGEVATLSEALVTEPTTYIPNPLPSFEPIPLSRAVDVANSSNPARLAEELLLLLPDSPPLPLINRLMLCLKPLTSHWSSPDFPYLSPDLDVAEPSLSAFAYATAIAVPDDMDVESMDRFASKVAGLIQEKGRNQAEDVSQILRNVAPQHPNMAKALVNTINLEDVFDVDTVEQQIALNLLDACANFDIAHRLDCDWFSTLLQDIQASSNGVEIQTQSVANKLAFRIHGWKILNDAISNTQGDFAHAVLMLKDLSQDEYALGVFLATMLTNEDLVAKLSENPVLRTGLLPLALFDDAVAEPNVSHDEFIRFLRAFIGVGSVLNAFSWTDSIPADHSRERTMAVMQLWQGVDGYRQILNHFLLIPQYTGRLEIIIESQSPPRPCDVMAERLLADLVQDPQAVLKPKIIDTILDMRPPFKHITEADRLSMRKVALVSEDGLPAAFEELAFSSDHPLSLRRLRTLRVSLAIVARELDESEHGEWKVLQALWEEGVHGLTSRLADIFLGVSEDLAAHFSITKPPPPAQHVLVDQLLRTGEDALKLIARMITAYPLTIRSLRALTGALADVFACTDVADMIFSPSTSVSVSASSMRQTCITVACTLSERDIFAEPRKPGARVVLRELLNRGFHSGERDPAYHIIQVFCLIDHVLPTDDPYWVTDILATVLPEIKAFFRVLDTENKCHFVKRLANLDKGVLGIGEWLLTDQLEVLSQNLNHSANNNGGGEEDEHRRSVRWHHISLGLRFLQDLLASTSWCIPCIAEVPEINSTLARSLLVLVAERYSSPSLGPIARSLAGGSGSFDSALRFATLLTLLGVGQESDLEVVVNVLKLLPETLPDPQPLQEKVGPFLARFATFEVELLPEATAESILYIMNRLSQLKLLRLNGISAASFSRLCEKLQRAFPDNESISALESSFTIDDSEDQPMTGDDIELPSKLRLSPQAIEELTRAAEPARVPSTPPLGPCTPDILGLITMSPPTSLLRSPVAATGLTRTYVNNDFRQQRQLPSSNMSRLPSMHVDVGLMS